VQTEQARLTVIICGNAPLVMDGIRSALEGDDGFDIAGEARTVAETVSLLRRAKSDVVILGADDGSIESLTALDRILASHPEVRVVFFTESGDPDYAQAAFNRGASGYIVARIASRDLPAAVRIAAHETAYHARGLPAVTRASTARSAGLTNRERAILDALQRGLTNRQIARELWVTEHTVKFHLTNIYRKAGVANRIDAVRWAVRRGVI
jgi:DNA-binding NarL/FixJ family response regulator